MKPSLWVIKTTELVGTFATWPANTTSREMSFLMKMFLATFLPFAVNQLTMPFYHHLPLFISLSINIILSPLYQTLHQIRYPSLLFLTFSILHTRNIITRSTTNSLPKP